jgi:rSAM/selenodomain-associated transferase 1
VRDIGRPRSAGALVVLARYPRPGDVKTRLAAAIGAGPAAALYRAFLVDIRRRFANRPRWVLHWAFDPAGSPFVEEIAGTAPAFPQTRGDLGERMRAALNRVLATGSRAAVLIGSDVPHLPPRTVKQAFASLAAGAELVLGPAEDGGYCLIGMGSVSAPVFRGIRWGGRSALEDTIRAARRAGIEPTLVPATYDVDDADGLERLRADIAAGRVSGLSATRRALERIPRVGYK